MIHIFNDIPALNTAVAEFFINTAIEAIEKRDRFTVALTGGSSPAGLYQLLTTSPYSEQISWEKVFVFWGDERWVPLDDGKSNAKMAFETLLNQVPIPKEQIFPMWNGQRDPAQYAEEYEQLIRQHLGLEGSFDLILLGMGDDGHTASLFPGTEVLQETSKWVDAYYLKAQEMYRITLTAPLINQAYRIAFIAYGQNKAHALKEVLQGERNIQLYPAQLIRPTQGEANWFVDEAAAALLEK